MALVNRFTKEEKKSDKKETIQMLKKGVSQAEIARQLGRSAQYISNLKQDLIAENIITQEEIDKAKQNAIEERKSKKKKTNNKEIIRQERKAKVLNGLKKGKTSIELMRELDIPSTTIRRDINELIEKGKIKDTDIVKQKSKNKKAATDRNEAILADIKSNKYTNIEIARKHTVSERLVYSISQGKYEELIKASVGKPKKKENTINPNVRLSEKETMVLSYLLKGYTYSFIAQDIGMSNKELLKIIHDLKIVHAINSEQIRVSRANKIINDEKEVIKYLKQGYRQTDILIQKREFNSSYLSRMITRLKEEHRITNEEIEQAIAQDNDNIEFEKLVLNGMNKGLTVKQIIESDENGYATESRVRRMKDHLISTNKISRETFNKQHKKNEKETKKAKYKELDHQIYNLIKKGVTPLEIATYLNLTQNFVCTRQHQILKNKKISSEKILEFQQKREKLFSETRIMAKAENESGYHRVTARSKFFELAKAEVKYGNSLQEEDIKMLGSFIIMNDKLLTQENLKLVILEYIGLGNYENVNKFIDILLIFYGNTDYGEALKEFNKFARQKLVLKQNNLPQDIEDDRID